MPREQESLRDLVESRAAWEGIASRKLWAWALDAIAKDLLKPILPEGQSLDTKFNHGGGWLTLRGVIHSALQAIERHEPSNDNWAKVLMLDPAVFHKWLSAHLLASGRRKPSLLPVRKRPPHAEVRRVVENYVDDERKASHNTNIRRMWEYVKKELPEATREQAKKAFHDIENGPKQRGRPRRAAPVRQ
jgi:hypothetical protein